MSDSKKILVVEDEAPIALAINDKLVQSGFIVSKASDGEEGLATALREHPDLILTDLKMPKMTGLEMISGLRRDTWGSKVNVIVLTNVSDLATIQEAMRHNTFDYLIKSDNSLDQVLGKIRALFGHKA